MKRREKILSITGLFLALVMIAGLGATLLSSTRAVPGDPIAGQASRLYPESLEDSDSTLMGQMSQTGGTPQDSNRYCPQVPDTPQHTPPTVVHRTPRRAWLFSLIATLSLYRCRLTRRAGEKRKRLPAMGGEPRGA